MIKRNVGLVNTEGSALKQSRPDITFCEDVYGYIFLIVLVAGVALFCGRDSNPQPSQWIECCFEEIYK